MAKKKTLEHCIIRFRNVHGDRYDYSLFVYTGVMNKSIIICPIHNKQFLMSPNNHVAGQGCPECASKTRVSFSMKTTEQCIIGFENKHGKGTYDYSLFINTGVHKKGIIICPIHNKQFLMTPEIHLRGCGCSLCKESNGERTIRTWLTDNDIHYIMQYNPIVENKNLKFDFWLPDYQLLIEFDGIQHYQPIERFGGQPAFDTQQLRDKIKTEWCIDNNIKLLRIPYDQIKKIPKILQQLKGPLIC